MIHVCFGLYDKTGRYSKFTGTAMLSLFDNIIAPPHSITVHILHDNTLTPDNHDKFIYVAGQYNQLVKFYNVEELCADKIAAFWRLIPGIKNAFSTIGTFFKLLIPQVLSSEIDKCIYLDSDMAINLDIKELWKIELGDKPLAAVSEKECGTDTSALFLCTSGLIKNEEYFNAGLILLNLNILRNEEEMIMEGVKFRGEHPESVCFDQDVWNYCFAKKSLKLPSYFNVFVVHARRRNEPFGRKIYHYAGQINSFTLGTRDEFYYLWMRYFMKTPWFDEETIGRLYTGFEQMYNELKSSVINFSAIMSGKTRAFFTTPENVEATKGIFSVRKDEEIILIENQESLQKLLKAMKRSKGKKIFFILYPYFQFDVLTKEGFVYGKDFLNGLEFLSAEQGTSLNSYKLIQAM